MISISPHPVIPSNQEHCFLICLLKYLFEELGYLLHLYVHHRIVDSASGVTHMIEAEQVSDDEARAEVADSSPEDLLW